jgi:hypothetical protein
MMADLKVGHYMGAARLRRRALQRIWNLGRNGYGYSDYGD